MILFEVNYIEPKKIATDFNKLGLDKKESSCCKVTFAPENGSCGRSSSIVSNGIIISDF